MTSAEFEATLLRYKYHEPFEPFTIDLLDGRTIEVNSPDVVFDENVGAYITPELDFLHFRRENVKEIRLRFGVAS
jgi:hypothetical protein